MCPFNCQATCQMPYGGLGRIIRRLRLRYIDNGSGHGSNHNHTATCFSFHQMAGHSYRKQIGAIDIDPPKLFDAIEWVLNGVKVLCKAGRSHQMIDFAVILDDFGDCLIDRVRIGDVGIVERYFWNPALG